MKSNKVNIKKSSMQEVEDFLDSIFQMAAQPVDITSGIRLEME